MKTLLNWAMMLPLIASLAFVSCSKEDEVVSVTPAVPTSPVDGKTLIMSVDDGEAELTAMVYADEELFVGYNRLYVVLYKKGTTEMYNDAHVTFEPMMSMVSGMSHACPIENPTNTTPSNGVFEGAVVFIMPSGASTGTWSLGVHVHNHATNLESELTSNVTVNTPAVARMYSFVNVVDSKSIFVSLVKPTDPMVGKNDFEVAIHWRENMMSFPFITNYGVEITPEMPSMGHGSPENVDPIHTSYGHYLGTANFTMSGYWKVNMTILDENDTVIDDQNSFDITF